MSKHSTMSRFLLLVAVATLTPLEAFTARTSIVFHHHHHHHRVGVIRPHQSRMPLHMTLSLDSSSPLDEPNLQQQNLDHDTSTTSISSSSSSSSSTAYQVDQADASLAITPHNYWSALAWTLLVAGLGAAALYDHVPQLAWHAYQHSLADHPVYTKAATSATVYAAGDVLAQRMAAQQDSAPLLLDVPRTMRSLIAGGIGHGPLSHVYYNLSEDFFGHTLHWTAWWSFIPKIVVDQALFGPLWNNAYLLLIGLMQGQSLSKIAHDMRQTTIPLLVSGLKLWPAVHVVTYGLLPVAYRLLWVDVVEIVWVSILATQAAAAAGSQTTQEQDDVSVSSDKSV